MVTNRVTVSLDADAHAALDNLTDRTGKLRSEPARDATHATAGVLGVV